MDEFLCLLTMALTVAISLLFVLHLAARRRLDKLEGEVRGILRDTRPAREEPAAEPASATTREPAARKVDLLFEREPKSAAEPLARPAEPPVPAARPAPRRNLLADVEWERWLGVRGAAIAGGVVLALAAVLLFKHLVTSGVLTPSIRVALGTTTGVLCLAFGQRLRGRRFDFVPGALDGAGLVAFYATIYAADERYHFLSDAASLPLMGLVTALACFLAIRHRSRLAIVLALVGGFATPLLLGTDPERPLTRFGYVLLLDLGLLFVGRKRGWGWVGALALAGTSLFEGLWIASGPGRAELGLSLVLLGLFALLFAATGALLPSGEPRRWRPTQASAVLFPFVFLLYFTQSVEELEHVWPLAALMAMLVVAASIVARVQRLPALALGASAAALLVCGVWCLSADATTSRTWELAATGFALAALPHLFLEFRRRRAPAEATEGPEAQAAWLASLGWLALFAMLAWRTRALAETPIASGLVAVALLGLRQARLSGRALLLLAVAGLVAAGHALHYGGRDATTDPSSVVLALAVAVGAVGLVAAFRRAPAGLARSSVHAAALLVTLALLVLPFGYGGEAGRLFPLTGALCGSFLVALAAARLGAAHWLSVALVVPFLVVSRWIDELTAPGPGTLSGVLVHVFLLAALPPLFVAFTAGRVAWARAAFVVGAVSALSGELTFVPTWLERFGDDVVVLPHFALALVAVVTAARLLRGAARDAVGAGRGLVWTAAAMVLLVCLGLGLEIDRSPEVLVPAAWALGLAALAAGLRARGESVEPERGLALRLGVILVVLATLFLCIHALTPGHYPRSSSLLDEVSLVHLPPALFAIGFLLFARRERTDAWTLRILLGAPALCAVITLFLWLNLQILGHYGEGERLRFELERAHERDLAMSLAWGVYALLLLALGTRLRQGGLRWASLVLFLLAIAKVFLRDLAHLEGLFRVASLAGLALSLLIVSLFYQRFVFRRIPRAE